MSNSLGTIFRITSFGESHGADVQRDLAWRSAANRPGATPRTEPDVVRFLSGVREGRTTGAPICMVVDNTNTEPGAYSEFVRRPRPGHADYTAGVKYGGFNDPLGGGRFSGRITAGFVMAGTVARLALRHAGIEVDAHTVAIGGIEAPPCAPELVAERSRLNSLSCWDTASAELMEQAIEAARAQGDSIGGIVECVARGLPVGLGEPVFSGVESEVARAVFSIPAVTGIAFGGGFGLTRKRGSAANDPFSVAEGRIGTTKNDAGGVLGGLTTGMPLVLRVAFKPTPSIAMTQHTVDLTSNTEVDLSIRGRHDACIVPRAVVVVEAMVSVVLCDLGLRSGIVSRVM